MNHNIHYRPLKDEDIEFIHTLYATTRQYEMTLVPWSDEEKAAFLRMQSEAQHDFYTKNFTKAEFRIILCQGKAIGRLYIDYRADEIRIIDITISPTLRGQGIGGQIMNDILDEGRQINHPVRIHVEQNNPAMRLYQRLGFKMIEDQGIYHLMEYAANHKHTHKQKK